MHSEVPVIAVGPNLDPCYCCHGMAVVSLWHLAHCDSCDTLAHDISNIGIAVPLDQTYWIEIFQYHLDDVDMMRFF